MKEKIHLIMPMAGAGSRFAKMGFELPKPLIEIQGKPFLYWSTKSIEKFVDVEDIIFIVLKEHIEKFKIDEEIKKYFPQSKIVVIPKVLDGAVLTCMEGIKEIKDNKPILFNDCDHMFKCEKFNDYCNKGDFEEIDGALLTFYSNEPKYSFLELDEDGYVKRTVEKEAISNLAICGAYYFKNKEVFEKASQIYLKNCDYNEFFVSGLYNIIIKKNKKIKQFPVDFHIPFGTPDEYKEAMKSDKFKEF